MIQFSVIIPLYNKENSIEKTLNSVFNQSFSNYEIIIINDGSTDKSEEKVKTFSDERLRVISNENKGVSQARNLGIELAKGTLIAFLDADDYWFPTHLEALFQLHKNFPESGLLATNYQFYYSDKKTIQPVFEGIPKEKWSGILNDFFKSSMKYRLAWTSAVAVKKEVFEKVGNFKNYNAGEDNEMWLRIALKYALAFDNQVSVYYNMNVCNKISELETKKKFYPPLNEFTEYEKSNNSLKKYLDLLRSEYALKKKLSGEYELYIFYLKQINPENLHWKTKTLLKLPRFSLKMLYFLKKTSEKLGLNLSSYH